MNTAIYTALTAYCFLPLAVQYDAVYAALAIANVAISLATHYEIPLFVRASKFLYISTDIIAVLYAPKSNGMAVFNAIYIHRAAVIIMRALSQATPNSAVITYASVCIVELTVGLPLVGLLEINNAHWRVAYDPNYSFWNVYVTAVVASLYLLLAVIGVAHITPWALIILILRVGVVIAHKK